jgi:hypothetical protein
MAGREEGDGRGASAESTRREGKGGTKNKGEGKGGKASAGKAWENRPALAGYFSVG